MYKGKILKVNALINNHNSNLGVDLVLGKYAVSDEPPFPGN